MKTGRVKAGNGFVQLSKIVLGTAEMGSVLPKDFALKVLDRYFEAGGRTIDTARAYLDFVPFGASQSERTIGEWLRSTGVRDQLTIITKGGCPESRDMNHSRLERKCIEYDVATSLAVLGLDHVDGYLLHRDDESIPVGEIMDVLDDVVKAGFTRFIGASNWRVERINEANAYAVKHGKTPFTISQVFWNMAKVEPGRFHDDTCVYMNETEYAGYLENKMPVMAYSSQAVGFFSKYLAGEELKQPRAQNLLTQVNIARAERCREVCGDLHVSPAALCLAYIACNQVDGYPIFGSSSMKQFEESMQAFDLEIDQKTIDFILEGK